MRMVKKGLKKSTFKQSLSNLLFFDKKEKSLHYIKHSWNCGCGQGGGGWLLATPGWTPGG